MGSGISMDYRKILPTHHRIRLMLYIPILVCGRSGSVSSRTYINGSWSGLKDRFGLSWQIVPRRLDELLNHSNRERARRNGCHSKMGKIEVAELERALTRDDGPGATDPTLIECEGAAREEYDRSGLHRPGCVRRAPWAAVRFPTDDSTHGHAQGCRYLREYRQLSIAFTWRGISASTP